MNRIRLAYLLAPYRITTQEQVAAVLRQAATPCRPCPLAR